MTDEHSADDVDDARLTLTAAAARPISMGDRAAQLADHVRAGAVLAQRGEPVLARGAAHVALVEALRMATTPAASGGEFGFKVEAMRSVLAEIEVPRHHHLSRLLGAALKTEAEQRKAAGLPDWRGCYRPLAYRTVHSEGGTLPLSFGGSGRGNPSLGDLGRYAEAATVNDDIDAVVVAAVRTINDMLVLLERGRSIEGAELILTELAFALSLKEAGCCDEVAKMIRVLEMLLPRHRQSDLVAAVIQAGIDDERERWGGSVAGHA